MVESGLNLEPCAFPLVMTILIGLLAGAFGGSWGWGGVVMIPFMVSSAGNSVAVPI